MHSEAFDWGTRLKDVEREYNTARLAMDRLNQHAKDNPGVLTGDLRYKDIGMASERLDGTYVVRLFAEFETALRHFMRQFQYREPRNAEALVNRVKDRGGISDDHVRNVHAVREYRNMLVHDRATPASEVSIRNATSYLGTFLAWLQRFW